MIKYIIRSLFIIFWATIIYGFLLLPYLDSQIFKNDKYLCIYTWADRIDESILLEFQRTTGIKIYVNYYESNEELLTKLEKMPFVDCDIIIPSGYIIDSMVQSKLIKKIDKSKCDFINRIYPNFLKTKLQIRDEYSLPLYWDVIGIGFNKNKIDLQDVSMKMIFNRDSHLNKKIGMIDDSRQSIALAALYLGYNLDFLKKEELSEMKKLLNKQKEWVGAYSDSQQGYYLASDTFNMVLSDRKPICQQMQKYDFISFKLPEEGSLLTIERIVISASSKKDDLIYQLINYLYSYKIYKHNCEEFCLLPVCKDVYNSLDQKYIGVQGLVPGNDLFKSLRIFKNILTSKEINDFWINLKAL